MVLPKKRQSYVRAPLNAILGSVGNVRVLRALVANRMPQSTVQLANVTGLTRQAVKQVLDTLVDHQVVSQYGTVRSALFDLNKSHPMVATLIQLFEQERTRWERLLEDIQVILSNAGDDVRAAWLYGSVARGEDTAFSDVDVAVVVSSQIEADKLRDLLIPLEERQHIAISLTALTQDELAKLDDTDPWWSDVVRDGRVLKGADPDAFMRKARARRNQILLLS